jgi:hypothetical protein
VTPVELSSASPALSQDQLQGPASTSIVPMSSPDPSAEYRRGSLKGSWRAFCSKPGGAWTLTFRNKS